MRNALLIFWCLLGAVTVQAGQVQSPAGRLVQGAVIDKDGQPLKAAVVHLRNLKTGKVQTLTTKADGAFSFAGLATNVDYQISATYHDASSRVQTLSALDDSTKILLNLKIASVRAPQVPPAKAKK